VKVVAAPLHVLGRRAVKGDARAAEPLDLARQHQLEEVKKFFLVHRAVSVLVGQNERRFQVGFAGN